MTIEVNEVSAGAATLKPGSRSEMMASLVGQMANMGTEDLSDLFNRTLEQIGQEAVNIPNGADASNRATIAAKGVVKEDFDALFDGDTTLTEDFKNRAFTLFEAAVELKGAEIRAELEDEFDDALQEETASICEEIHEAVDAYISRIALTWLDNNQLAVDSGIRGEVLESFVEGLRDLFVEHAIEVPEQDVDVVEQLASELERTRAALDEEINNNIELADVAEAVHLKNIVDEMSEGLTLTQRSQFNTVIESVEFADDEELIDKLKTIREGLIERKPMKSTGIVNEATQIQELSEETSSGPKSTSPSVRSYAGAISRTARKV
jgi:Zn-dependent M16 (insulinase) family peptidase